MKVDKSERKICLLEEICSIRTGKKDANHADDNGCYPFFTCGAIPLKSTTYSFEGANLIVPGNGDIGRCFYYDGKIILTNGFVKKTQKTPKVEIERAKTYRDDYIERCDKNEKI